MEPSNSISLRIGRALLVALALGFAATSSVFASSGTRYYLNDHLATTVGIADAAGEIAAMEADAFGSPLAGGANPGRFTGKPYDEDLGAYVLPFRNYRSAEKRWMSADPSGFPDGVNGRLYVNDVNTQIDPYGLWATIYSPATPPKNEMVAGLWRDISNSQTSQMQFGYTAVDSYVRSGFSVQGPDISGTWGVSLSAGKNITVSGDFKIFCVSTEFFNTTTTGIASNYNYQLYDHYNEFHYTGLITKVIYKKYSRTRTLGENGWSENVWAFIDVASVGYRAGLSSIVKGKE